MLDRIPSEYEIFVDQCQATITESATVSRWALVEGYWILGQTIREYMISKEYAKAKDQGHNLIHSSENQEDAAKEITLWFAINEIHDYKLSADEHFL